MPYQNEHAARLVDPDQFDDFRRENGAGGDGVDFIWGIKDGNVEIQAIRFDAEKFTEAEAKKWLDDHDFKAILFEPAAPLDEGRSDVVYSAKECGFEAMKTEIRALSEPVKITDEGNGSIRVAGYASVFGEETNIGGMFTEVVERGAFTSALERGDDVVFLVNHEGLPLARTRSGTLKLTQDDRGLFIESELDPTDPDVQSIVPKMKRGDLDKMSFAFIPQVDQWDDSGDIPKRTIKDVRLYDVSIVTTPAYDGTEIGLRSLQRHRDEVFKSQAARRLRMKARLT